MMPTPKRIMVLSLIVVNLCSLVEAGAHERKSHCGGAAHWRFECKLAKKTKSESWNDPYSSVAKAHIELCFDNRGGHHESFAMIFHYDQKGDHHSNPLTWFNTVKWKGKELDNRISWKGTGPRITGPKTWMTGNITVNEELTKVYYTEKIYKRRRLIREAIFHCTTKSW